MRKSELIDIYILEILERRANKEHRMLQKDLMRFLYKDYGVQVSRNTLNTYVSEIKEKKYIAGDRGIYRVGKFSEQELRFLIDGVLYGQHIPAQDAKVLIEKLKSMSELGLKDCVKNVYYLEGINRTQNNRLYEMIDKIDDAIQHSRKLRIVRCSYNEEKKLVKSDKEFIVNPYQLVTEKSRYYLICFVGEQGNPYHRIGLVNLRVDRFWNDYTEGRERQLTAY